MRRLAVPGVIVAAAVLVGLAACAARNTMEQPSGPETPSPVPITLNPSAMPVGDTIPTGVVVGRKELVLYFWGNPQHPYLDSAWRDQGTGVIDADTPCNGGVGTGADLGGDATHWLNATQCAGPGDALVEYGAVRGDVARVTSQSGGATVQARYARWSANQEITVFWLQRKGKPAPQNVELGTGNTSPLPPDQYPLITAYDAKGATIAQLRLRPSGTEQKGG
jgi:hypothetical protein